MSSDSSSHPRLRAGSVGVLAVIGGLAAGHLTASLVDATLAAGEAVTTLNLNVSFLRPARSGPLQGEANFVRRGRDICHVGATLSQDGTVVASAVATCKVLR